MTGKTPPSPKFSYDVHARACAPDDFMGQVCRTIQGKPLSEDQFRMIIKACRSGLDLKREDVLLELACGNGFLSKFLFGACKGYLGVDISEYMISVARDNFELLPDYQFVARSVVEYVRLEEHPERFTKVLCYASFQYIPDNDAEEILRTIFGKFSNVQGIFIGNLPDRECAEAFYKSRLPSQEELSDCSTAIGKWRTKLELQSLANKAGWKVRFSSMPECFHSSRFRYDAFLSR